MAIVTAQQAAASSDYRYSYQVFLSFRGEDTRKAFTDHLYTALVQAGLRTFRDEDEIERGKKLDLELRKAIQQSRISIIVFSKNYAYSKWCLEEVSMILEWSSRGGNEVLPIFYDVDPSDVRKQRGSIGEAFSLYEKELIDAEMDPEIKQKWTEKLKSWRVALEEIANLAGNVLSTEANGYEAKFIQEIVAVVRRKLELKVLHVDQHLVGMEIRVRNIDSWVKDSSSSENILVISGMGGIGKTTIAKYVYNSNYQLFEGSSFLASVKKETELPHGLINLQMQLLSSILKGKKEEIHNVDEGIIKIKEASYCKRILVVLDDVDEVKQLDALLGTREFHRGSKIIITTRNKSLLKAHEVHKLHEVQGLSVNDSFELFCWHAYGKELPPKGYEELSIRALYRCVGLPLAHKILGSSLAGKSKKVWASMLEKLEAMPDTEIVSVLKISFHSLNDDHDRNLFLNIACFFVGYRKDETIEILDSCDFYSECGVQNLIDRCLLSIDADKIVMHQLVQEMGWEIVDEESRKEPGKRSRVWRPKDSYTVLKEKKGTERIEGLVFDLQIYKNGELKVGKDKESTDAEFYDTILSSSQGASFTRRFLNFLSAEPSIEEDFNYDAFSRLCNLSLLKLNYTKLSGCPENFPEGLRWLCYHGFPLKSIPFDLPLQKLVSLDMSYSKLEHVWIGNKVLVSLKILNLSHSERLIKTPNFRGLPNLENLILKGCVGLVDICDTIGGLKRLASIDLENCRSLRRFPNIGMLKSLRSLRLDGCSDIIFELQKVVDANVTGNSSSSTFRDQVKQWYTLLQQSASKPLLRNQQLNVSFPQSLVNLSLHKCNLSDDDFVLDFSQLSMLKNLDLSNNHFLYLPQSISSLSRLKRLSLRSCQELLSVPDLPNTVNYLDVGECRSLERVAHHSPASEEIRFVNSYQCGKLTDIQDVFKLEPLDKVNREILDIFGLQGMNFTRNLKLWYTDFSKCSIDTEENTRQGLSEFGIFSTFLFLGEIPDWCVDLNSNGSSSVSFLLPSPHPSLRIRGLSVYTVYKSSYCYSDAWGIYRLFIKIYNKTKDLSWTYAPVVIGIPENNVEELVWVSHWNFGSQMEFDDEVDVSVIGDAELVDITEVHIKLEWGEEEEEEMNGSTHNHHHYNARDVIGGDLSTFQFMSTNDFFLSHQFIYPARLELVRKLFGDHIEYDDILEWMFSHANAGWITELQGY